MFFTQNQVLEEVASVQAGEMSEEASPVFAGWCEIMERMVEECGVNLRNGFRGFYQRSPREILGDLNNYDRLNSPLTREQIDEIVDEKNKYSPQFMPDHTMTGTLDELRHEYDQTLYVGWNLSKTRTDTCLVLPFTEDRYICYVWNNPNQRLNLIRILELPTHS